MKQSHNLFPDKKQLPAQSTSMWLQLLTRTQLRESRHVCNRAFLIDSGAKVSVLPASVADRKNKVKGFLQQMEVKFPHLERDPFASNIMAIHMSGRSP